MSGIFQTRAPSRSPITKIFGVSVPNGATVVVDSLPFTGHVSAKWLVTAVDTIETKKETYEVLGSYLSGAATPSYTVYARTGNKVKNTPEVILSGGDLALRVTNTQGVDIVVDVLRFELSP